MANWLLSLVSLAVVPPLLVEVLPLCDPAERTRAQDDDGLLVLSVAVLPPAVLAAPAGDEEAGRHHPGLAVLELLLEGGELTLGVDPPVVAGVVPLALRLLADVQAQEQEDEGYRWFVRRF